MSIENHELVPRLQQHVFVRPSCSRSSCEVGRKRTKAPVRRKLSADEDIVGIRFGFQIREREDVADA